MPPALQLLSGSRGPERFKLWPESLFCVLEQDANAFTVPISTQEYKSTGKLSGKPNGMQEGIT